MKMLHKFSVMILLIFQAYYIQGMLVSTGRAGSRYYRSGRNVLRTRPASTSTISTSEAQKPVDMGSISPTLPQNWWDRLWGTRRPNPAYERAYAQMRAREIAEEIPNKMVQERARQLYQIEEQRTNELRRADLQKRLQLLKKIDDAEPVIAFFRNANKRGEEFNSPESSRRWTKAYKSLVEQMKEDDQARVQLGLDEKTSPYWRKEEFPNEYKEYILDDKLQRKFLKAEILKELKELKPNSSHE